MSALKKLSENEPRWRELERLLARFERFSRAPLSAEEILRLGALHRAACVDLLLAIERDAARETVEYLQGLVGRSHNRIYRATGLDRRSFAKALFEDTPRRLLRDPALRIAAAVFLGLFLVCGLLAAGRESFAPTVLGRRMLHEMDAMYRAPIGHSSSQALGRDDSLMTGFYIQHNTSIGLRCFAWGVLLGIGSLYELVHEAIVLGTVFGYMMRGDHAANFYTFVTAHSVFELSAIILSAAAGLRMGWGLVETQGAGRIDSLKREAIAALPALFAAVVLFFMAAFVEGFVSASPLPYPAKLAVAIGSLILLACYLALGRARSRPGVEMP